MKSSFHAHLPRLLPHALVGGFLAGFYMIWLQNETPVQGFGLLFVILYLWVFFTIFSFVVWTRFLAPRLAPFTNLQKIAWLFGCLLAGFWLADNIPVVLLGSGLVRLLLFVCVGIGIGLLLFMFTLFFATRRRPASPPVRRRLGWLVFALPMIIAWVIYLLAYWPGMMSADSLDQWGQALSGQFNNHHPAFHTFTIWLLIRIAETPAIVALAQIVALALAAGSLLAFINDLGVSSFWVWTAALLLAVSPANGTMVVTLWKDVPYSAALLGFTYLVFRIAYGQGRWITRPGKWLVFGGLAALVGLLRHNGWPVVALTLLLLLLVFRRQWRPLAYALALSLVLYYGATGPVYRLVGVQESDSLAEAAASLYNIAASADAGSGAEAVLRSMDPLSNTWQCSVLASLSQADINSGPGYQENLVEKGLNLVKHGPRLLAYNYRCNRSLVWIIWDPNGEVRNPSHAGYWIDPNPYGIEPASKIPQLEEVVTNFVLKTAHDPGINWLVWRPALYLYLFLLVIIICALRTKNALILLAAAPVLIQSLSYMMITMPPNFRYHYLIYLLALSFWPVIFMPASFRAAVKPASETE